ncbi:hypothetical protein BC831DRAFT_461299 [Entophlyctis helioformis]|nr:hypothetical protein BC831DRAFT_461299 [Entophlyctis helioformis]
MPKRSGGRRKLAKQAKEEEYRESASHLLATWLGPRQQRILLVYAVLQIVFVWLDFGIPFFILSLLSLIVWNTTTQGREPQTKSAYSVFNSNVERLDGSLTAEQFEKEILRKPF